MKEGIIFDVDGVIVDVSESYIKCIIETTAYVTERLGRKFIPSLEHLNAVKSFPGYNNEWDVTAVLVIYPFTELPFEEYLRKYISDGREKCEELAPENYNYELVSRTFDQIYLGSELYEKFRGRKPNMIFDGTIDKEKLLVRKITLRELTDMGFLLGIFTGRPEIELKYTLEKFGIDDFFRHRRYHVNKPDGKSLKSLLEEMGCRTAHLVGDSVDDYLSARDAGVNFIGIGGIYNDLKDINSLPLYIKSL